MKCETVRVVANTDTGFKVINKSDFNSKEYKLFKKQIAKKADTKQDGGGSNTTTVNLV